LRDPGEGVDRDVPFGAFNGADIGTMEIATVCEGLLRNSERLSARSNILRYGRVKLISISHSHCMLA